MEYLYILQQALVWIITIFWLYNIVISACSLVKLKEKPMPIIYTTADICKMFHIGRVKCLELFHRADFPAQKYGRGFGIEANALTNYMSSRHIIC